MTDSTSSPAGGKLEIDLTELNDRERKLLERGKKALRRILDDGEN